MSAVWRIWTYVCRLTYIVWRMSFDVRCLTNVAWRASFTWVVWGSSFDVCRLTYIVSCMAIDLRSSMYGVWRILFVVFRLTCVFCLTSFDQSRLTFIVWFIQFAVCLWRVWFDICRLTYINRGPSWQMGVDSVYYNTQLTRRRGRPFTIFWLEFILV